MKVTLNITGTAPLLMHNSRLSNPIDPIVRAMKEITGKRKKTDADLLEVARLEFHGGLYHVDALGPYLPGQNIEKCIVEGGRITKQGKQVERGLFVTDAECPVIYSGPRSADDLWDNEAFRSMLSVKVGQSRVMRCRPIFRDWSCDAVAEVDESLLNLATLQSIVNDAGAMVGMGDFRPRYGRFECLVVPS